jgi:ribosomal protein S11
MPKKKPEEKAMEEVGEPEPIQEENSDENNEPPEETEISEETREEDHSAKATVSKESEAVINIYTSFNNTLVHVTDMSGRTISKITGGMITKHDRLKANPTIAMFIAKRITEEVKDLGIKSFYVRIRAKTRNPAPGPGAHSIIKSLTRDGFKIINILDTTRMPRGGPKQKGGRRGRRP